MNKIILALLISCLSCVSVEEVDISKNGNMNCYYDNTLVYSGNVSLNGKALDRFEINGTWVLCSDSEESVKCIISIKNHE